MNKQPTSQTQCQSDEAKNHLQAICPPGITTSLSPRHFWSLWYVWVVVGSWGHLLFSHFILNLWSNLNFYLHECLELNFISKQNKSKGCHIFKVDILNLFFQLCLCCLKVKVIGRIEENCYSNIILSPGLEFCYHQREGRSAMKIDRKSIKCGCITVPALTNCTATNE